MRILTVAALFIVLAVLSFMAPTDPHLGGQHLRDWLLVAGPLVAGWMALVALIDRWWGAGS